MTMSTVDFYDKMAPFYHLIFPQGFDASIERHGSAVDAIIRDNFGPSADTVLDVSCGIGTQALGLALLGYQVTASDLSPKAVARAKQEASRRNLSIDFSVADMREASTLHTRRFHIVLSADNSVPHLLTDDDISAAFNSFYQCSKPGGGCIITVRDYEKEDTLNSNLFTYGLRNQDGMRYLVFQVRDPDGHFLDISMYFVEDDGSDTPKTHVMRGRYYAVTIPRLMQLLESAGFVDVARNDGAYFQPVITGRRCH
jgi:SAM-dependent methyltransferase